MAYIEDGEFDLDVFPINNRPDDDRFTINVSEFMVVKFYADITLLTPSPDQDEDDLSDMEDNATHNRYVYDEDFPLVRGQFLNDENGCRAALVNALTRMPALPLRYYNEIVDKVFEVFKDEEKGLDRCGDISVCIEILNWAENDDYVGEAEDGTDDEEGAGEERRKWLRIEPTFPRVLVDENMINERREDCVICLSGFEVGAEVYKLHCQHVFHCGCLLRWLEKSVTCPLCRKKPPNVHVLPAQPSKPT